MTVPMKSINPATEELVAEYPPLSRAEQDARLNQAAAAFSSWRQTPVAERASSLRRLAVQLRSRADELARLMTVEMGKPIRQAAAEVEKCAWGCEFYAEDGPALLTPQTLDVGARSTYVRRDPIGPVLAVMPWNFPFWQVLRFAAPTLLAGNTAVLKHASNVCGCAVAIESLFHDAGFPQGVFTTLLIPSSDVAAVVAHPAIRAASVTGSDHAGRSVAAVAGQHLKKCVLELGGSDPFIVLEDADVSHAAAAAAKARTLNSGQSCVAAKRFLVADSIADEFVDSLVAEMEKMKVGDPLDEATEIGPLARADLRDDLHSQVERSLAAGASLRTGGNGATPGFFYRPTVLDNVRPGTAAFDEETFGPAAAIIRCRDETESVELANRSAFGLGASVWSRNVDRAERLASQIDSGMVFVNEIVKSDPRVPFGGVKDSGYGRELGEPGLCEFVNAKTVWVA